MTVIEESAETDVEFSIESKPAFLLGKGKVPEDLLDDLNDMCDDLLADPDTPSYAPFLVGEIQNG